MKKSPLSVLLAVGLLVPAMAHAHEPLWGESPQTFGFGVLHPEIRFAWENDSALLRGATRIANPDALRMTRLDLLPSVQFAPRPTLNLKIEAPLAAVTTQQRIQGRLRTQSVVGLGDVVVSAKNRFKQHITENYKTQLSYTVGLKLPTGLHNGRMPDGSLLSPSNQPGSGQFGVQLGFAFDYERIKDTVYFSASYRHELTGSYRLGDQLLADVTYGRWLRLANKTGELGVFCAVGPHGEFSDHDHQVGGVDGNSGRSLVGMQASIIAIKGQAQFRAGLLIPVYQRANGTQVSSEIQFRAGAEWLL